MGTDVTMVREAMESVSKLILAHRYQFGDEKALQLALARLLDRNKIAFEREKQLSGGPIDFFLNETAIGLEIKTKGSPSAVSAQLLRYANDPALSGILLVTTKTTVARFIPSFLAGKPSGVVSLLGQAF